MEQYFGELSPRQRALMQMDACPNVFAVVSWGCAATSWIANILNRHPDIYCVHAANHIWNVLGNCDRLDGVPYLRVVACEGQGHMAAGCVHGVSRHLIPECRRAFGKAFNAVVVVREPIIRLRSQLALFQRFPDPSVWNLEHVDEIVSRKGIVLPVDDLFHRSFVHGANMLNAILEEGAVGKIYRCEDLTRNPEILGDFLERITGNHVSPSAGWLHSAVQRKPMNVHAGNAPHRSFDDWQIDVIRRVVDPRAWELYEALGYPRPTDGYSIVNGIGEHGAATPKQDEDSHCLTA